MTERIGPSKGAMGEEMRMGEPLPDCCECDGTGIHRGEGDYAGVDLPCMCLEYQKPPVRVLGAILYSHYDAVALWVGNPAKRLMGWSFEYLDQIKIPDPILDEMVRLDQEMGLR